MVIITTPSPTEKATAMVRPLAIRPAAMAASKVAMAAGQGTNPPEIPRTSRFHLLYGVLVAAGVEAGACS